MYGGMATIVCAAIAMLAAQRLERMASLSILVSAGILLSAMGFAQPSLIGCGAVLSGQLDPGVERAVPAGRIDRTFALGRSTCRWMMKSMHAAHGHCKRSAPRQGVNLDDDLKAVVGQVIPWTMAFLGLSFVACALLIIGMPPLSGFIGKLSLLSALVNPLGLGSGQEGPIRPAAWGLMALLILSGLASLIAFARLGVQRFWTRRSVHRPCCAATNACRFSSCWA